MPTVPCCFCHQTFYSTSNKTTNRVCSEACRNAKRRTSSGSTVNVPNCSTQSTSSIQAVDSHLSRKRKREFESVVETKKVDVAADGTITTRINTVRETDSEEIKAMISRHVACKQQDERRLQYLSGMTVSDWFRKCPFLIHKRKNFLLSLHKLKSHIQDKFSPTNQEIENISYCETMFAIIAAYAPWREFNRIWAITLKRIKACKEVVVESEVYDYFIADVLIYKALLQTGIDGKTVDDAVMLECFTSEQDLSVNDRGDHFQNFMFILNSNDPRDMGQLGFKVHFNGNWFPMDILWMMCKDLAIQRVQRGMEVDDMGRAERLENARQALKNT